MEVHEIKARLKAVGRTQQDLARHLGLSKSHISFLLNGRKRMALDTFRRIEAFLEDSEGATPARGVAETTSTFAHEPRFKSLTLAEARALKKKPLPRLPPEEQAQLVAELMALGDAYRTLIEQGVEAGVAEIEYDENGLPT